MNSPSASLAAPTGADKLRWSQAAWILLAVFLAANWQILTGRAFEKWDAYDLASPYYSLLADFTRAGRFLYWDPWVAGGSPDFAIAGSGTFSPDLLLFAALTGPGTTGYLVYWLTIWVSGGFGILLLARHLRVPAWGALAVALGFVFSGFYTGHAEHSSVLYSYTAMPFIIWRLDIALVQRRILAAVQAGALWGLSALAGYPAFTIYTVGLIVLWAVGRCFIAENAERARDWKHALLAVTIVGVVGIAVLSPSYVSAAYEGAGYSDRSGALPRSFALNSNALHPGALATLVSPSLADLNLTPPRLWSYTDISCLSIYTGSVIVLLALAALVRSSQRRWRFYIFGLALLALACAMSQALPFRGWLYDLVPPTRFFRHSAMLRSYFLFLLSILALFGAKEVAGWRTTATPHRLLTLLLPAVAVAAVAGYAITISVADMELPQGLLAGAHVILIWGSLLAIAFALHRVPQKAAAFLPIALVSLSILDALLTYRLSEITILQKGERPPLPLPASSATHLGPAAFSRAQGTGRANLNYFFKVPTLNSYAPFENRFHRGTVNTPALRAMALGSARVWFTPDAPEVSPTEEMFQKFASRITDSDAPLVVRHSRAGMLGSTKDSVAAEPDLSTAAAATAVETKILVYRPDELVLEMTAPSDGWLMVTDRWSRSWNATVNGQSQIVAPANFIFRAVPVVQGANHIEFTFRPLGLPALIFLSWGTLAAVAAATGFAARRKSPAIVAT